MPLTSTDFMAAPGLYGIGNQPDKLDVSDVLAAILLKDTSTLGQIKMEGTVSNIEHFWFEDQLNSCVFSAQMTVSTELDVYSPSTSAQIRRVLRQGAVIRQEGFYENVFQVVGTTKMCTGSISVAYYGSASVWNSLGSSVTSRWFVVAQPMADTRDYSDDISMNRTRRRNFTQVFERGIRIAETREHIALYAVPDELKHQIKLRTYEIKRELNNSVLNGIPYITGGSYTPDIEERTMAGIIKLIRDANLDGVNEDATVINAAGGALTLTRINDLCKLIYDYGGFDDQSDCCIITSPHQARVIALLEESRIRKASNELIVGSYANAVKTDLGFDLPVVVDRWCPAEVLIVLDRSRARLMPLAGDAWHLEKMAKTGRTQGYQLSGQYTLELRNASQAHGCLINLQYS